MLAKRTLRGHLDHPDSESLSMIPLTVLLHGVTNAIEEDIVR